MNREMLDFIHDSDIATLKEGKVAAETFLEAINAEIRQREGEAVFAEPLNAFKPVTEPLYDLAADLEREQVLCEICGDPATCGERCTACCEGCLSSKKHGEVLGGEA